ncbi:hypothetical protein [Ekhidna sp. To15]|uniref:hypothetical protein n=1 Tax=Ekhidna sp. To15 TaxID=3395267 RepID=UPI003F5243DD
MKTLRLKQLAFLFVIFLIACQEDSIIEEVELVDEDMIAATQLADEYFNDPKAKREKGERAITILKYEDGNIYFNTNTDDVDGYQIVEETTITAHVEPGEFVFWYRGGGLDDLEEVDFDEDAEAYLDELPDEYKKDKMWVLHIPSDYDPEHNELKYDIVYESKDDKGVVVRLDPKIRIGSGGDAVGEDPGDSEGPGEE